MLGYFYSNGWGVKQNGLTAIALYERSAARGNHCAHYNLGLLLLKQQKYDQATWHLVQSVIQFNLKALT